jgi:choline dehydrogenase
MSPVQAGGFFKTDPTLPAPDCQVAFYPIMGSSPSGQAPRLTMPWESVNHTFAAIVWPSRPYSAGTVTLAGPDPLAAPIIDPRYLSDERDVTTTCLGMLELKRILNQDAFTPYRGDEILPGPAASTTLGLIEYIRRSGSSGYHLCGTAKMGRDRMAVVDPQLQVHGVEGLRIADASIFPTATTGNTNAPTIMVAERAADLIRNRSIASGATLAELAGAS